MKLRRKPPDISSGRRRRQSSDVPKSASAFAYRSSRTDEAVNLGRQVPRQTAGTDSAPRHLGRFLLRRFGLIILLIALVVSSINVLSLSSNVKVLSLTGADNSAFMRDKTIYQTAADKLLAESIWNRNKITVNTAHIDQEMLKQFPELSSVSITLPLLSKRPIVYVQTAQPALVLAAQNGSFVVDTTGKALLRASDLPADNQSKLPLVTDQSGLGVNLNHQALSSGSVSFIQAVVGQLAAAHLTIASLTLPADTSELDVRIAGQPYVGKFNLESGDARQQAGTFLATQAKLQSQRITPAQYIDVRVDGRAYYK